MFLFPATVQLSLNNDYKENMKMIEEQAYLERLK